MGKVFWSVVNELLDLWEEGDKNLCFELRNSLFFTEVETLLPCSFFILISSTGTNRENDEHHCTVSHLSCSLPKSHKFINELTVSDSTPHCKSCTTFTILCLPTHLLTDRRRLGRGAGREQELPIFQPPAFFLREGADKKTFIREFLRPQLPFNTGHSSPLSLAHSVAYYI